MLNNTTLIWIQSRDPKNDDFLYKDGVLVDKNHEEHEKWLRVAITINAHFDCIYDKDGLSIYKHKENPNNYIINSTFEEVDYVERHIAFIANVTVLSQNQLVDILNKAITSSGYSLSQNKLQTIDAVTRKKKIDILVVAMVILASVVFFALCFKMCQNFNN